MPKNLFFLIVETDGLPTTKDIKVTKDNIDEWPQMVGITYGWGYYDKKEKKTVVEGKKFRIVKPTSDRPLPEKTLKFHKINNQQAKEKGKKIKHILKDIQEILSDKKYYLVCHNPNFHVNVLQKEFNQAGIKEDLYQNEMINTMTFCSSMATIYKFSDLYWELMRQDYYPASPKDKLNALITVFDKILLRKMKKDKAKSKSKSS